MSGKFAKILVIWVVLFGVSLAVVFLGWNQMRSMGEGTPPIITDPEQDLSDNNGTFNLALGIVSALTSAAGFIVTTFFALREDSRNSAMHSLEIKKMQQDIEEKQLEIERLRRQQEPPDRN